MLHIAIPWLDLTRRPFSDSKQLNLFHGSLVEVKVLGYQMQGRKRHGGPPRA